MYRIAALHVLMGVKHGLSHSEKHVGGECSRIGCGGRYLELTGKK
jgi:hypothetical protein